MASRTSALLLSSVLLALHALREVGGECNNVTSFSTQMDIMLAEYDRETVPAGLVRVELALDVRHAALNDRTSTLRLLADLKMKWLDPRVGWNASEWGCDSALTSAERLWVPDVTLLNAGAGGRGAGGGDGYLRARISSDGRVSWIRRLDVSVPVAVRLDHWPEDVQTAAFKFGSRAYDADELELDILDDKFATVFEAGAWEIEAVKGSLTTLPRVGGQGDDKSEGRESDGWLAVWEVRVRRRAAAQAMAASCVLTAGVLLLVAAVLTPPAARAPLCACAAFVSTVWLMASCARATGGSGAPRSVYAACVVCAAAAAGCAAAALAVRVAQCSLPPPRALRSLLAAASHLCKLAPTESTGAESGVWGAAGALLDRAVCAALLLTCFAALCIYL